MILLTESSSELNHLWNGRVSIEPIPSPAAYIFAIILDPVSRFQTQAQTSFTPEHLNYRSS